MLLRIYCDCDASSTTLHFVADVKAGSAVQPVLILTEYRDSRMHVH